MQNVAMNQMAQPTCGGALRVYFHYYPSWVVSSTRRIVRQGAMSKPATKNVVEETMDLVTFDLISQLLDSQ